MSLYCTQAQIQGEIQASDLISMTDDAPKTGAVNVTVLNQVITNASGDIDQYLGAVYDVPFSVTPISVSQMAVTLTCYRLLRRREVPDEKNKFYEDKCRVIKQLEKYQTRELTLDLGVTQDFAQVAFDARPTVYGLGNYLPNSL